MKPLNENLSMVLIEYYIPIVLKVEYTEDCFSLISKGDCDIAEGENAYRVEIDQWNTELLGQKPSESDIMEYEGAWIEYRKSNEYKEKRRKEYPPIEEQLDIMYWDSVNGTNNWQTTITEIKNKYPKS